MASVTSDVSTSTLTLNCGPHVGFPWPLNPQPQERRDWQQACLFVLLLASPVDNVCLSFSKIKILFFNPRWPGFDWLIDWLEHCGPHSFIYLFIYFSETVIFSKQHLFVLSFVCFFEKQWNINVFVCLFFVCLFTQLTTFIY